MTTSTPSDEMRPIVPCLVSIKEAAECHNSAKYDVLNIRQRMYLALGFGPLHVVLMKGTYIACVSIC